MRVYFYASGQQLRTLLISFHFHSRGCDRRDSLVMNHSVTLEMLVDDDYDVVLSHDCLGLNSGSVLWKNTLWTHAFLAEVFALHSDSSIPYIDVWWEQAAIRHLLDIDSTTAEHVKVVPARSMNAWPGGGLSCPEQEFHPGDFVVHFPGILKEQFLPFMIAHNLSF